MSPAPGSAAEAVEVIVEIPKGSRNKYEYDHERHVIFLDRRLFSATTYPTDYGFVPDTLAEDGDPLDVLVIVEEPTFPGCHLLARPVGLFLMSDEHGPDAKVIAVPARDPRVSHVREVSDLTPGLPEEIAHFFDVYKDLEPGKVTSVKGFSGVGEAVAEIAAARDRYRGEHTG